MCETVNEKLEKIMYESLMCSIEKISLQIEEHKENLNIKDKRISFLRDDIDTYQSVIDKNLLKIDEIYKEIEITKDELSELIKNRDIVSNYVNTTFINK